jgi:putative ABC transport system permease protein
MHWQSNDWKINISGTSDLLKSFMIFTGISLAIACLGLFALVSYAVKSRTKEIGNPKSFGCFRQQNRYHALTRIHCADSRGCIIAIPASYYFMQQWLEKL